MEIDSSYFRNIASYVNTDEYNSISENTAAIPAIDIKNIENLPLSQIQAAIESAGFLILNIPDHSFSDINVFATWQSTFLGNLMVERHNHETLFAKIQPKENSKYYATSSAAQPLHTDEGYTKNFPDIVSLYCETPSSSGGLSTLVQLNSLLTALRQNFPTEQLDRLFDDKAILVENIIGKEEKSILLKLPTGTGISYSPTLKSMKCSNDIFELYDFITTYIHNPTHQIRFSLKKGQLLIFDNCRTIHGRTKFPESEPRTLYRFWFQHKVTNES